MGRFYRVGRWSGFGRHRVAGITDSSGWNRLSTFRALPPCPISRKCLALISHGLVRAQVDSLFHDHNPHPEKSRQSPRLFLADRPGSTENLRDCVWPLRRRVGAILPSGASVWFGTASGCCITDSSGWNRLSTFRALSPYQIPRKCLALISHGIVPAQSDSLFYDHERLR